LMRLRWSARKAMGFSGVRRSNASSNPRRRSSQGPDSSMIAMEPSPPAMGASSVQGSGNGPLVAAGAEGIITFPSFHAGLGALLTRHSGNSAGCAGQC
jgi:hypothetical protein